MKAFRPDAGNREALDPRKRVNHTLGLVLGEDEFRQEQRYLMERDQRHHRALHGYGTVAGLKVSVREGDTVEVVVAAGIATDPCGRDVCVPVTQCADLSAWLGRHDEKVDDVLRRPEDGLVSTLSLYVVLAHRECATDEVPVPSGPCRSEEESMTPSRIADAFELRFDFEPPEEVDERVGTALRDLVETLVPELLPDDGERPGSPPSRRPEGSPPDPDSPPSSPPDSPPSSPPGGSPEEERIRGLVREWVTTGRARLLGDDSCVEVCGDVLLARLDIGLRRRGGGFDVVGPVDVDERDRPWLVTTRLLQEWLINRSARERRPFALDDLVDVDTNDAVPGEVLTRRGDLWVAQAVPEGGTGEAALRRHKRHLHGWGIVCGLQVRCGAPDTAQATVTVDEGYAIDCEGNDIVVAHGEAVDVLALVEALQERDPDVPVLEDGDGEVCLTLEAADDGHRIGIEPYDPSRDTITDVLAGTMLMDVYTNCVKPIEDFFREELGGDEAVAGPAFQRKAVLVNLLAHVLNPRAGQNIYLSRREHELLHGFYGRLRELLRSETFCAMFADARPLPDYPAELPEGLDTIFGRGQHARLRLRRRANTDGRGAAREAYTVAGGSNSLHPTPLINRYDLERRVLIDRLDPFDGVDAPGRGVVHDIAFSADRTRIWVVAAAPGATGTFVRMGGLTDTGVSWLEPVTLPDVTLVTLATTNAGDMYAIGVGQGLYRLEGSDRTLTSELVAGFAAAGHLRITADALAVVTVADEVPAPGYDGLHVYDLSSGEQMSEMHLESGGVDDIAVSDAVVRSQPARIYVVTGLDGSGDKRIEAFDLGGARLDVDIPVDDAAIRLAVFRPPGAGGSLVITSEDGYVLRSVDLRTNEPFPDYRLALQAGPIAVAADSGGGFLYVLNYLTDTITVASAAVLDPAYRFPFDQLAEYRRGVLEAFSDLLGGFLQYLKDCLCHHLLVDCPECTGDERLMLACVSIRSGEVAKVCNFSGRRYVKSFPTVGYWSSLVPVLPLAGRLVDWFCCLVLPDVFGRFTTPGHDVDEEPAPGRATGARVRGATVRRGLGALQDADLAGRLRRASDQLEPTLAAVAGSLLEGLAADPSDRAMNVAELLGQPSATAEMIADARGVGVRHVGFDPTSGTPWVDLVGALLRPPRSGGEVTLHERDARVRTVSVSSPSVADERLQARVAELEAELEQLRTFRAEVTSFMERGDQP